MDCPLLQAIYQQQSHPFSPFDEAVKKFFDRQECPSREIIDEGLIWKEPLLSEETAMLNWKELLAVNFLCKLSGSGLDEMENRIRFYEAKPWNHQSQYFRSVVALNHALVGIPIPATGTHLLPGGAALIDLYEYRPWLSLPFTPQHFEYGIFLGVLALLTQRDDLKEHTLRMAHWQTNTLDADAVPLAGLFVREQDGSNPSFLVLSYLLFRVASLLDKNVVFENAATASIERLMKEESRYLEPLHPLWPLLERWLFQFPSTPFSSTDLADHIHDPSTALVGCRKKRQHVICTLHGEHTGLGSLRQGDVEIINYGPQYLPLEDCRGFGIEGNVLSDHGARKTFVDWRAHSFSLKGCARLVDQPAATSFGMGLFRGIWIDIVQEYKNSTFNLKTTFMSLEGWDSVVFSFFVKASSCQIGGCSLKPNTLERYEGEMHKIVLEGQESKLDLEATPFEDGAMTVIPLAGTRNFWGANFLIAYSLSPKEKHYNWKIGSFI
jgi:hypothetical protein